MAPARKAKNPTEKSTAGDGSKTVEKKKRGDGKKAGKKKRAQSRYKDPSKMCWDPFPMFAYDVKDVNRANKCILLVIISILWCFSVVTVCVGVYLIVQRKAREEVISAANFSDFWLDISVVLVCNGIVSSIITFCGLVGVLRENIPLIRVFYISLIVMLLLKVVLATFVFVFADYSRPLLEAMLAEQAVVHYRTSSGFETLLDYLQTTFFCCGLRDDGFQDWSRNIYFNCSDGNPSPERCGVPWSCCRNDTGVSNPLCGLGVQKLDRNIASRTIYTMGCLHAIQRWVFSHAVAAGLLVLLEISVIVAVTFQCTRLVNELQMMTGVYRGPWWDWVCKSQPRRQRKAATSEAAEPPPSPRPPSEPSELPSEAVPQEAEPPSVLRIGHGPAVRRAKAGPSAGQAGGVSGAGSGRPPGGEQTEPSGDSAAQQGAQNNSTAPNPPSSAGAVPRPTEEASADPSEGVSLPPSAGDVLSPGQPVKTVAFAGGSRQRVFATRFRDAAGTELGGDQTELSDVAEMLELAAEKSYFCHVADSQESVSAVVSGTSSVSTESVDSESVRVDPPR